MDKFILRHFKRALDKGDLRKCQRFIKRYGNVPSDMVHNLSGTISIHFDNLNFNALEFMMENNLAKPENIISRAKEYSNNWKDYPEHEYYKTASSILRYMKLKEI